MSPYTCVDCGTEYRTELGLAGHICPRKYPGLAPSRTIRREPTDAMIRAGTESWQLSYPGYTIDRLGDVWRAMWDAAPPMEGGGTAACAKCGARTFDEAAWL